MTMRERLIEAAMNARRTVGHRQHMENVLDAILTTLAEPDEGTVDVLARVAADGCIPELGDHDFGFDHNSDHYQDCCRNVANGVVGAMITHVRSGK